VTFKFIISFMSGHSHYVPPA